MNSRFLRTIVVLASVISISACDDSISESTENLRVTIDASRPEFQTGDTTTITVSVTNNDAQSVMISVPACAFGFEVRAEASTDSPFTQGCLGEEGAYLLAAGETREFTQLWLGQNRGYAYMLSPGKYSMRGFVKTRSGELLSAFTPIEILPR